MKTILAILACLAVLACKKNKTEFDLGYAYVPLQSGITTVYQVRDIFHDEALLPAHDTNYYQIKSVIGDSFIDDIGDTAFKLNRFIRATAQEAWQVKDVWTIKNTGTRIEIVEENIRLIDFVFAPSSDKSWNANVLNEFDVKNSQYTAVHKSFVINGFNFDSTCTVSHQAFTSFVDHNVEKDVFAKGVGKVYTVLKELTIDNFDTLDIKKGLEIEYRLIDYSK